MSYGSYSTYKSYISYISYKIPNLPNKNNQQKNSTSGKVEFFVKFKTKSRYFSTTSSSVLSTS